MRQRAVLPTIKSISSSIKKVVITLSDLLKIGKSANHSMANRISPKTCKLLVNREANNTEAKMAAFVDKDPGYLIFVVFELP